ncbi:aminotransferase class I/II-fold pyridoxal phosphate-dependent enzyme [Patescibacteria group bacterium]|nr:aminotransferase class I/II-fold pyridoxal phosphate-dependent enzyme [Patescibacteria group bacterium]
MAEPKLSEHFKSRKPSALRIAQIEFEKRTDNVTAINTAIGNVSLPMHPAMQKRMFDLGSATSPFKDGVVKYTTTVGTDECRDAFLNIIKASNCDTKGLHVQITEGASEAMGLMILGCCGPAGTKEKPLMVIDASYTNYISFAERLGRSVVSMKRHLGEDGKYSLPDYDEIRAIVKKYKPGALLVIPYDNPTGHFFDHETMVELAKICVEGNMWMVSDEAYRELHYLDHPSSSIWKISEKEAPGITGRRIGIDSASKIWNACGLRIGALITDNQEYHEKSVAENTANLCPNAIGQYIFGALAHESKEDLDKWFDGLRKYYKDMMNKVTKGLREKLPGIIVSNPDSSIYSVVDVRNLVGPDFSGADFVHYCATKGKVDMYDKKLTLLVAPMEGFYNIEKGEDNPGRTQFRIAYVLPPEEMALVPDLFAELFNSYTHPSS